MKLSRHGSYKMFLEITTRAVEEGTELLSCSGKTPPTIYLILNNYAFPLCWFQGSMAASHLQGEGLTLPSYSTGWQLSLALHAAATVMESGRSSYARIADLSISRTPESSQLVFSACIVL